MRNRELINCALAGIPLALADVARVSHSKRTITLRRAWPEDMDGRVWRAIDDAVQTGGQKIANHTLRAIGIYDPRGWMIGEIEPCFDEGS